MPNGSHSPFYEQPNVDNMQRGNGAGILVDYDEYGYEVMDSHGAAFSGSQQMPHTATFYPEQRSSQHHSRQMKPPRKPYKGKSSQKQRGQGPSHGRRKNPRRKYSSEEGTQDYDLQGHYNRGFAYPNESEVDGLNA